MADKRSQQEKQHDKVAPNGTGRQRDAQTVGAPGAQAGGERVAQRKRSGGGCADCSAAAGTGPVALGGGRGRGEPPRPGDRPRADRRRARQRKPDVHHVTELGEDVGIDATLGWFRLSWLVPVTVDAAGVVASRVWLKRTAGDEAVGFARVLTWLCIAALDPRQRQPARHGSQRDRPALVGCRRRDRGPAGDARRRRPPRLPPRPCRPIRRSAGVRRCGRAGGHHPRGRPHIWGAQPPPGLGHAAGRPGAPELGGSSAEVPAAAGSRANWPSPSTRPAPCSPPTGTVTCDDPRSDEERGHLSAP